MNAPAPGQLSTNSRRSPKLPQDFSAPRRDGGARTLQLAGIGQLTETHRASKDQAFAVRCPAHPNPPYLAPPALVSPPPCVLSPPISQNAINWGRFPLKSTQSFTELVRKISPVPEYVKEKYRYCISGCLQGWDLTVVDFFVGNTCSLPIWPFKAPWVGISALIGVLSASFGLFLPVLCLFVPYIGPYP